MKTILNTFICLTLFMLGWTLGVTIESESDNLNNVYLLWFVFLGLLLLRFKIIND